MSYKLADVIWNDDGTMTTKKLSPLDALKRIKNAPTIYVGCASDIYTRYSFECKEIEKALERLEQLEEEKQSFDRKLEKKLKALEIIKEKPVVALVDYKYTYEEWLELVDEKDRDLFKNKEEYELLKEVLL